MIVVLVHFSRRVDQLIKSRDNKSSDHLALLYQRRKFLQRLRRFLTQLNKNCKPVLLAHLNTIDLLLNPHTANPPKKSKIFIPIVTHELLIANLKLFFFLILWKFFRRTRLEKYIFIIWNLLLKTFRIAFWLIKRCYFLRLTVSTAKLSRNMIHPFKPIKSTTRGSCGCIRGSFRPVLVLQRRLMSLSSLSISFSLLLTSDAVHDKQFWWF